MERYHTYGGDKVKISKSDVEIELTGHPVNIANILFDMGYPVSDILAMVVRECGVVVHYSTTMNKFIDIKSMNIGHLANRAFQIINSVCQGLRYSASDGPEDVLKKILSVTNEPELKAIMDELFERSE